MSDIQRKKWCRTTTIPFRLLRLTLRQASCFFTSEIDVVGIDEAQFFDEGLTEVCNELANNGIRVIVAGLDMDYKGIPFGPIPSLCAIADEVTKVHAICVKCGDLAYVSHRTVHNDKRVLLGGKRRLRTPVPQLLPEST